MMTDNRQHIEDTQGAQEVPEDQIHIPGTDLSPAEIIANMMTLLASSIRLLTEFDLSEASEEVKEAAGTLSLYLERLIHHIKYGPTAAVVIVSMDAAVQSQLMQIETKSPLFEEIVRNCTQIAESCDIGESPMALWERASVVYTPDTTDPETGEEIPGKSFILPDEIEEYRQENPVGAKTWEKKHPTPTAADKIKGKMARISLTVDMFKDPQDAILSRSDLPQDFLRVYELIHLRRIFAEAARRTGSTFEDMIDPAKRSDEQKEAIKDVEAEIVEQRHDKLFRSLFYSALESLKDEATQYDGDDDLKEKATLLFFANHAELHPLDPGSVSDEERAELAELLRQLDTFYLEHGPAEDASLEDFLASFVETSAPAKSLTNFKNIRYNPLTSMIFNTDKAIHDAFFSDDTGTKESPIPLKYEKAGGKEITLSYFLSSNEKQLQEYNLSEDPDPFQFLLIQTCDNLLLAGNSDVTLSRIYEEMGYRDRPSTADIDRIYDALTWCLLTLFNAQTKSVKDAWKTKGRVSDQKIDDDLREPLLSATIQRSGNDGRVRIKDFSPFFKLANYTGHLMQWDKEIFSLYPKSRSDRYFSVFTFLLREISFMRTGRRNKKILFKTLFEHTKPKYPADRSRDKRMMFDLLETVFKVGGYISKYEESSLDDPHPGVTLTLTEKALPAAKEKRRLAGDKSQ